MMAETTLMGYQKVTTDTCNLSSDDASKLMALAGFSAAIKKPRSQ